MIRNTTLPPRVRAEAQLQLTKMHCYTRPTQIRNRCIMGGQGRGVLSDFKMTRVGSVSARSFASTMTLTTPVPIPYASDRRKHSRCEPRKLVKGRCGRRRRRLSVRQGWACTICDDKGTTFARGSMPGFVHWMNKNTPCESTNTAPPFVL